MNNNYENSNYLYNYYDFNYYNSINETNERRIDSLYENSNLNSNIDYKIASNIASNYRQYSNGWTGLHNYGWTQLTHPSYYEPNYIYNNLEPINNYQSLAVEEVESFQTHFPFSDIQSHNYLEQTEGVFRQNSDNLIPVSVQEVEKQIKTETKINCNNGIAYNESRDLQRNCFQLRPEVIPIGNDNSYEELVQQNNENLKESTSLEMEIILKAPRIRRINRKHMSYEELKRDKRESNRLAATKCRQKKLLQLDVLDKRSKLLLDENDKLERNLNDIKSKVFDAKLALIYHRNNGCLLNAFRN